jgi:hypothetical protein
VLAEALLHVLLSFRAPGGAVASDGVWIADGVSVSTFIRITDSKVPSCTRLAFIGRIAVVGAPLYSSSNSLRVAAALSGRCSMRGSHWRHRPQR